MALHTSKKKTSYVESEITTQSLVCMEFQFGLCPLKFSHCVFIIRFFIILLGELFMVRDSRHFAMGGVNLCFLIKQLRILGKYENIKHNSS